MTRTTLAIRMVAAQLTTTGLTVGLTVLSTPILLHLLGPERIGLVRIALTAVSYLMLLDLGLGGALIARYAAANTDGARTARLVRGGRAAYWRVAALMALGLAGLVATAPFLVQLPPGDEGAELLADLRAGFAVHLVALFSVPLAVYGYLASTRQRGDWVQTGILIQSVVGIPLGVLLAWLTGSVAGPMLGTAVGLLAGGIYVARKARSLVPVESSNEVEKIGVAGPEARRMTIFTFCSQLGLYSDVLIVGRVLGPEVVTAFSLTQRLLLLVATQVVAIAAASWAPLADLHFRGEAARFALRLAHVTSLTAVISAGLLIPAAAATPAFVRLWVGADQFAGLELVLATVAYQLLQAIVYAWVWPLIRTGRVGATLPLMVTGAFVNLIVSITASATLGPVGPALGTLVNVAGLSIWWLPMILRREFQMSIRPLFTAVAGPFLLAIPFALVCFAASMSLDLATLVPSKPGQWGVLIASSGFAAVCYLVVAWFLTVPGELRQELIAKIRRRKS